MCDGELAERSVNYDEIGTARRADEEVCKESYGCSERGRRVSWCDGRERRVMQS